MPRGMALNSCSILCHVPEAQAPNTSETVQFVDKHGSVWLMSGA